MFNRDIFIPSLSTVVLAGMIAFLSCAHQAGQEDDVDDYFSDMVSAENSSQSTESSSTDSSEPKTNELSDSSTPQNQELASSSVESQIEAQPSAVIEPSQVPAPAPAPVAANNEAEIPIASSLPSDGTLDKSELNQEPSLAQDATSLASLESELDKADSNSSDNASMKANPNEPVPMTAPVASATAPAAATTPALAPKPAVVPKKLSMVPRVPQKALRRKEGILNRFYFVRMGDTPESVSTLIYGSPDKSHQLWVSKGLSWAPGRMIFYSSPQNPTDMSMVSFYKEEGVQGRGLKVKRGDWLSRIAHKYLGSPKSWKEIAVMNRIENPLDLKVGQKLMLFPEIKPKPIPPPQVAVNESPNPAPVSPPEVVAMNVNPQPTAVTAPPPAPAAETQPRMPLAVKEEKHVKPFSARAYIRELIEKLTRMLGRKPHAPSHAN